MLKNKIIANGKPYRLALLGLTFLFPLSVDALQTPAKLADDHSQTHKRSSCSKKVMVGGGFLIAAIFTLWIASNMQLETRRDHLSNGGGHFENKKGKCTVYQKPNGKWVKVVTTETVDNNGVTTNRSFLSIESDKCPPLFF